MKISFGKLGLLCVCVPALLLGCSGSDEQGGGSGQVAPGGTPKNSTDPPSVSTKDARPYTPPASPTAPSVTTVIPTASPTAPVVLNGADATSTTPMPTPTPAGSGPTGAEARMTVPVPTPTGTSTTIGISLPPLPSASIMPRATTALPLPSTPSAIAVPLPSGTLPLVPPVLPVTTSATASATKPAEPKPAATPTSTKPAEPKPAATPTASPTATKPSESKSSSVTPAKTKAVAVAATPAETKVQATTAAKAPVQVAMADTKATATGAIPAEVPPQARLAGKTSFASPVVGIQPGDWNQWGGSSVRNNIPEGKNIADHWVLGDSYLNDGEFKKEEASKNVLYAAAVGSQTYGNPVVANGKLYVGTNNGAGWLKRYPPTVDLGCLICFDAKTGKFLWQHSSEKLPTGRVHDWPQQGICCSPLVEGERLWFVSSRGLVLCLDTEGFYDGENDGEKTEPNENKEEADVIWSMDMMNQLGVSQHNMCSCSVTDAGDFLWICTGNGVDDAHIHIPAPNAPSFIALDKNTGKVLWKDSSPGKNILHGQWSSPAYAVIDGVPQLIFAGGDAWLYSFRGDGGKDGKPELLWKFDANPKTSKYILGGRGTRNEIIATPVIYDDKVYLAVGQDPEHGEGNGHLWCIDPKKRGDISPELAFDLKNPNEPIPHERLQAVDETKGQIARPNPNSGVIWHYSEFDGNGDKEIDWEEEMHRTLGTVVVKDDLLYICDLSGLYHCVDAQTGHVYWTHDLLAACWGTAMICDGKVYLGDEEGKMVIAKHSKEKEMMCFDEETEKFVWVKGPDLEDSRYAIGVPMGNSIYTAAVVSNNTLYIANRTHVFAIAPNDGEAAAPAAAAEQSR